MQNNRVQNSGIVVQWGDMSTNCWRPSVRYYETILLNIITSFLWQKASRTHFFFGSMSGNALMKPAGAYSSSGSSEDVDGSVQRESNGSNEDEIISNDDIIAVDVQKAAEKPKTL